MIIRYRLVGSGYASDDFYELHHRDRIEKMHSNKALRTLVTEAISVMLSPEVLVAKIAALGAAASRFFVEIFLQVHFFDDCLNEDIHILGRVSQRHVSA